MVTTEKTTIRQGFFSQPAVAMPEPVLLETTQNTQQSRDRRLQSVVDAVAVKEGIVKGVVKEVITAPMARAQSLDPMTAPQAKRQNCELLQEPYGASDEYSRPKRAKRIKTTHQKHAQVEGLVRRESLGSLIAEMMNVSLTETQDRNKVKALSNTEKQKVLFAVNNFNMPLSMAVQLAKDPIKVESLASYARDKYQLNDNTALRYYASLSEVKRQKIDQAMAQHQDVDFWAAYYFAVELNEQAQGKVYKAIRERGVSFEQAVKEVDSES